MLTFAMTFSIEKAASLLKQIAQTSMVCILVYAIFFQQGNVHLLDAGISGGPA